MRYLRDDDSVSSRPGYVAAMVGGLAASIGGGIAAVQVAPLADSLPPFLFLAMPSLATIWFVAPEGGLLILAGALGSGVAVRLVGAQAALKTAIATAPLLWFSSGIAVVVSRRALQPLIETGDTPAARIGVMSFGLTWAIVTVIALVAGRRLGVAWHRRRAQRSPGNA